MRLLRLLSPLVALVALFVVTGCGGGSGGGSPVTTYGRVEGTIYLSDGAAALTSRQASRAAVGAEVRVLGTALLTHTDENGHFVLSQVPTGAQTVAASMAGYATASWPVTVLAGQTVSIADGQLSPTMRKWTVMVYMNSDNDLEPFGIQDMNELESVPDSDEVTTIVQMDRTPGYDSSNGDWTDTKRFLIRHDTDTNIINSPVLEDMGEQDMGDPATLRTFLNWGMATYPAEHYLVVIWNHGSGWRGRVATDQVVRWISYDESNRNYITTTELPGALAAQQPLDIVSFDACLMQMLEISYEIRNVCRYTVASEEDTPGEGYPYQTWLGLLLQNPDMSARDLGATMSQQMIQFYGTYTNFTHSAVDTAELEGLATAVDGFARALQSVASANAAELAAARDATAEFGGMTSYRDLYDYAAQVKFRVNNASVRAAADAVMAAVGRAVVAQYHGQYSPNSHGISIYIPERLTVSDGAMYDQLALSGRTQWNEWLKAQLQ